MAYVRTSWIARIGTALNRFLKTNEDTPVGTVELTNDPSGVTTGGTPFTVANMNKIEDGIYDAHVLADNHIADVANPHAVSKEQVTGLKTTDSPTFVAVAIAGVSKATAGYTRLPNGLLLQWGTDGGTTSTISFPIAFTTVYQVTASPTTNLTNVPFINSISNTSFGFVTKPDLYFVPQPCRWMAIGI